jgi:hypothetical protein
VEKSFCRNESRKLECKVEGGDSFGEAFTIQTNETRVRAFSVDVTCGSGVWNGTAARNNVPHYAVRYFEPVLPKVSTCSYPTKFRVAGGQELGAEEVGLDIWSDFSTLSNTSSGSCGKAAADARKRQRIREEICREIER